MLRGILKSYVLSNQGWFFFLGILLTHWFHAVTWTWGTSIFLICLGKESGVSWQMVMILASWCLCSHPSLINVKTNSCFFLFFHTHYCFFLFLLLKHSTFANKETLITFFHGMESGGRSRAELVVLGGFFVFSLGLA